MKTQDGFEKLLHFIYERDKMESAMPLMKATKLLEDMKRFIEKYSREGR